MDKKTKEFLERNQKIYEELAEKRAIKILGLKENEVFIGKAFESTKQAELILIKNEVSQRHKRLTMWDCLLGRFN